MKNLLYIIYAIFIIALIQSCAVRNNNYFEPDCPDTTPVCSPMQWKGISVDTSSAFYNAAGYRYKIQLVQNINSPENEWGVSFVNPNSGILTYDDNSLQKIISFKRFVPEQLSVDKGFNLQTDDHFGFPSVKNNKIAIAVSGNTIQDVYNESEEPSPGYVYTDKTIGLSEIFVGKFINNEISDLQTIGISIASKYMKWNSQPALSPDGRVLFFSSDIDGGFGGTDIWYTVQLSTGDWSPPINCGDSINTACDEITPFITYDGKNLYFASKGHDNLGGFDIFRSDISEQFWKMPAYITNYFSNVKNMRSPLNTKFDEISPNCPGDCDSIFYYSSNQMGFASSVSSYGQFDIYVQYKVGSTDSGVIVREEKEEEINVEIDLDLRNAETLNINPTYSIGGKVRDENNQPINNAIVTVSKIPEEKIVLTTNSDISGNYFLVVNKGIEYEIKASTQEHFTDKIKIHLDPTDTITDINQDFVLKRTAVLRINFQYDKWDDPYKYTIDSNGVETGNTWYKELDDIATDILNARETVRQINLVGHTDDIASVAYNYELGLKRVNFVKDELIKRGVPEGILSVRSAGKLEPLAKRNDEDISLYRKRLRRVTLEKVMK